MPGPAKGSGGRPPLHQRRKMELNPAARVAFVKPACSVAGLPRTEIYQCPKDRCWHVIRETVERRSHAAFTDAYLAAQHFRYITGLPVKVADT
jgi:hypothetical protein